MHLNATCMTSPTQSVQSFRHIVSRTTDRAIVSFVHRLQALYSNCMSYGDELHRLYNHNGDMFEILVSEIFNLEDMEHRLVHIPFVYGIITAPIFKLKRTSRSTRCSSFEEHSAVSKAILNGQQNTDILNARKSAIYHQWWASDQNTGRGRKMQSSPWVDIVQFLLNALTSMHAVFPNF